MRSGEFLCKNNNYAFIRKVNPVKKVLCVGGFIPQTAKYFLTSDFFKGFFYGVKM